MIVNENNCGSSNGMEIQDFRGQCTCGPWRFVIIIVVCLHVCGWTPNEPILAIDDDPCISTHAGDIFAHQRIQDIIIDTQINPVLSAGLCGLNGACHPVRDVQLERTTNVRSWAVRRMDRGGC